MTEGDRDRVIAAEVISKAWKDENFRAKLLRDPRPILAAAGLKIPDGCRITVLENSTRVSHISIPRPDQYKANKDKFMAELERCLPLPEGVELRLHQNTDRDRYLVLPLAPMGHALNDEELMMVAGGGSAANATTAVNAAQAANVQTVANATTGVNAAEGVDVAVAAVAVVAT